MRAASLVVLATCLAALALVAAAGKKEEEAIDKMIEMSSCCKTPEKMLYAFPYGGILCGGMLLMDMVSSYIKKKIDPLAFAPELKDGCVLKCIFNSNSFLNKDEAISEGTLRRKLMKEAKKHASDVQDVVADGLDKCIALAIEKAPELEAVIKEENVKRLCKQEAPLFMSCFSTHILLNCPKSEWENEKEMCAGKREQYVAEVIKLVEEANTEDEAAENKAKAEAKLYVAQAENNVVVGH